MVLLQRNAAMTLKNDDLQKINELIEIMKQNDLAEVEIKHGDDRILLKRRQPEQPAGTNVAAVPTVDISQTSAAEATTTNQVQKNNLALIKSPLVGTFYASPSPDSAPFVEIGSHVDAQTVVCIIEAMKVMNEIKAETSGTIVEILVGSGQAIEYGQVLFKVKPD
jgi:acetyl-CoA carboxylase biotin carboxyl carrier protein